MTTDTTKPSETSAPDTSTLEGKIAVMQAAAERKVIERRNLNDVVWDVIVRPVWDWAHNDYRIAPEPPKPPKPKYRPWNADDMILGVCLQNKQFPQVRKLVVTQLEHTVKLGGESEYYPYSILFSHWTLLDGSPCGVKVNDE